MTTPILGLPELAAQQSQPDVTLNTSLILTQALLMGAKSIGDNSAPASPDEGDVYIVGTSPTGAWANRANTVAIFYNGWKFVPDRDDNGAVIAMGAEHEGMSMWVRGEIMMRYWDGTAWVSMISDTPPLTSTDAGIKGQLAFDAGYLYVCTDTDTWARVALGSF